MWRSVLLAMAVACYTESAMAQTVRVISPELAVRSRPDASADVVAIVAAGTVLSVIARQEAWYEVQLPGTGQSGGQRGYVLASAVEPLGAGTPATASGGGVRGNAANQPGALGTVASPSADWQTRRDRALGQRRSGVMKVRVGLPFALAGTAALIYGSYVKGLFGSIRGDESATREYWTYVGAGAALITPGAILMTKGTRQMNAAARELLILEDERLRAQNTVLLQSSWGDEDLRAEALVGPGRILTLVGVGW
jgi:hypothetical protein